MLKQIKSSINRNLVNSQGWRTNRKIVVIESDDWGSIRMPDKETVEKLKENGFKVDRCAYMQNDSLESNEDLEYLFNFIENRDKKPVITANFLTANPDFKRIRQANFEHYYNESLDKTLAKYPNHDNVKKLWIQGLSNQCFIPQLHGREHLNIMLWMNDLQNGNEETLFGFNLDLFGISANTTQIKRQSYQAAFGKNCGSFEDKEKILTEANNEFYKLFGYFSKTFIAPNYTWDKEVESILHKVGVTHFQGANVQRIYNRQEDKITIKRHYLGEKNELYQKYLIRNVSFEPFSNQDIDWVSLSLKQIENAFFWKKPAVIAMHRVNFVGSINPANRERNLKLFEILLNEIEKKWPEVEYMSSDKLAKLI